MNIPREIEITLEWNEHVCSLSFHVPFHSTLSQSIRWYCMYTSDGECAPIVAARDKWNDVSSVD